MHLFYLSVNRLNGRRVIEHIILQVLISATLASLWPLLLRNDWCWFVAILCTSSGWKILSLGHYFPAS
jgi:hypothetical protein